MVSFFGKLERWSLRLDNLPVIESEKRDIERNSQLNESSRTGSLLWKKRLLDKEIRLALKGKDRGLSGDL